MVNKFLIDDLISADESNLPGLTIVENDGTTYKYIVSNLSSLIDDQQDPDALNGIADAQAVYDYIQAQDFLGPGDLDTDTPNLVVAINALLNKNDLYLFVRQDGVRYSDIKSNYDVVITTANYKTPIWLNKSGYDSDGSPKRLRDNNENYSDISANIQYDAFEDGPIFFKRIIDAVNFSKHFKFLDGSQIYIIVLSDIKWPIDFHVEKEAGINTAKHMHQHCASVENSDNCTINIVKRILSNIEITYKYENNKHKIQKYKIDYIDNNDDFCHTYIDKQSLYDSRWNSMIDCYSNPLKIHKFIFDYLNDQEFPTLVQGIYCIRTGGSGSLTIGNSAFLYADYGLIGCGFQVDGPMSFIGCDNGVYSSTGNRSTLDSFIEFISCDTPINAHNGSVVRNFSNNNGPIVAHTGKFQVAEAGYMSLGSFSDYPPNDNKYFISCNVPVSTLTSINQICCFVDASYIRDQISSSTTTFTEESCQYFAVNPKYNHVVRLSNDIKPVKFERSQLSGDVRPYLSNMVNATIREWPERKTNGYINDGFITYRLSPQASNPIGSYEYLITNCGMYDDYINTRFNPTSPYRILWDYAANKGFSNPILPMWAQISDYQESHYMSSFTAVDLSNHFASNGFSVTLISRFTDDGTNKGNLTIDNALSSTSEYIDRLISGVKDNRTINFNKNGLSFYQASVAAGNTYPVIMSNDDDFNCFRDNSIWLYGSKVVYQ